MIKHDNENNWLKCVHGNRYRKHINTNKKVVNILRATKFIGAIYPEALLLDYYYVLCIINLVLLSNGSHDTLHFKLFRDIEQRANR